VEIKEIRQYSKVVAIECDVCAKHMKEHDDESPYAVLYLNTNDFPINHLCEPCYGEVLDYINVDMRKNKRQIEVNGCSI
jgi:hypothetical protein